MTRYVTQPSLMSCGPVAIINALKWAGFPATLKNDYKWLAEVLDCEDESGCVHPDVDRCLRDEGKNLFTVHGVPCPSIKEIEAHLRKEDRAVLISCIWRNKKNSEEALHATLFLKISRSGRSFTGVNVVKGETLKLVRRRTLVRCLRRRFRGSSYFAELLAPVPFAWFLTKIRK